MMSATRWMILLGFAALVGALTLRRLANDRTEVYAQSVPAAPAASVAATRETGNPEDPTASTAVPSSTSAHTAPRELLDSTLPMSEAVPRLREYADAGDPLAQIQLTWHLRLCTPHSLAAASQSDRSDLQQIELDKNDTNLDEALRAARLRNMQFRIDTNATAREACAALPAEWRDAWLDPIDRAAQAGNVLAMRLYAEWSIADYDSVDAIVADVDTAIERRDKARRYLAQALERGDAQTLSTMASAYSDAAGNSSTLFAANPQLAYAYAYAGGLAGLPERGWLERIMESSEPSLDASQLAQAQALGRTIFERCCAKR